MTDKTLDNHIGKYRRQIIDEIPSDGTTHSGNEVVELLQVAEVVFNPHASIEKRDVVCGRELLHV